MNAIDALDRARKAHTRLARLTQISDRLREVRDTYVYFTVRDGVRPATVARELGISRTQVVNIFQAQKAIVEQAEAWYEAETAQAIRTERTMLG